MKNLYFTFILLLISNYSFGQTEAHIINNYNLIFKNYKINTEDADRTEVIDLYQGKKKILSHILFKEKGDCSSISIQLGNYFVEKNKIIFYSYWASADRMPSFLRFGFQKQVYSVTNNGIVKLKYSKIYIEDLVETDNPDFIIGVGGTHKGFAYLNKKPITDEEKMWLDDYVKSAEKQYNAKFVFGEERQALEKEVREKLKEKIAEQTNDWDIYKEAYGKSRK